MTRLDQKDKKLIEVAAKTAKRFSKIKWKGERLSGIGAALRTKNNKIYSAANIYHPESPSGICAECIVIAKAYNEKNMGIDTIVAYFYWDEKNQRVISPCGKCREFIRLFGNPWIIINVKNKLKKVRLNKILPFADNW